MIMPWASMIIGTRRTMPSRSGSMVIRPRPPAAFSSTSVLRSSPGNLNMNFSRVLAQRREPRDRECLVELRTNTGQPGFAQHDARAPHRIGEKPIVARQLAQPCPGFLVEIAKRVGRDIRVEPVGLREHDVEGNRRGAEPGQIVDHVRDPGPRPGPLTEPGAGSFRRYRRWRPAAWPSSRAVRCAGNYRTSGHEVPRSAPDRRCAGRRRRSGAPGTPASHSRTSA